MTGVHVVWRDDLSTGIQTMMRSSHDGGTTWNPSPTRLDDQPFPNIWRRRPALCADGAWVGVAFGDGPATGEDVWFVANRP